MYAPPAQCRPLSVGIPRPPANDGREAEWLKLRTVSDSLRIQMDDRCEVQRWAIAFLSPSTHADEGFMKVLLDWLCNKVAVMNLLQVPHVSGAPQFLPLEFC